MRAYIRVVLRQHRFELRSLVLIAAAAVAATLFLIGVVASLDIGPCLASDKTDDRCLAAGETWSLAVGAGLAVAYATAALVTLFGLVLGVELVARELESRTVQIVWTLAPSRRRWFFERVMIIGAVLIGTAVLLGLAFDGLEAVGYPVTPLGQSFGNFMARGWMLPAYAAAAFGIGAFWGTVLGRGLPALIVSLVVGCLLIGGVIVIGNNLAKSSPVALQPADLGALVVDFMLEDATDGKLISFDEAYAILPQTHPDFEARFTPVRAGIPGDRSMSVIGGYVLVLFGSAVAALMVAAEIVDRRRTT